jgi:hypothetical protein
LELFAKIERHFYKQNWPWATFLFFLEISPSRPFSFFSTHVAHPSPFSMACFSACAAQRQPTSCLVLVTPLPGSPNPASTSNPSRVNRGYPAMLRRVKPGRPDPAAACCAPPPLLHHLHTAHSLPVVVAPCVSHNRVGLRPQSVSS